MKKSGDCVKIRMPEFPTRPTTIIPTASTASIVVMGLLVAATAVLLAIPIPDARHHRVANALLNLGHVPLFALLAATALSLFGNGSLLVCVLLVATAAIGELLQAWLPGRAADLQDLVHGVVGIGIAWLWWSRKPRFAWRVAGTFALVAIPLVHIGPNLFDALRAKRQFPVLSNFSGPFEAQRWQLRQARLVTGDGPAGLIFQSGPDEYPGAEIVPIVADWRDYKTLEMDFQLDEPLDLNLSIRDQRPEQGFAERYNFSRRFDPGRHLLRLSLADVAQGASARPLDLSQVDSVNLFISNSQAPASIRLHQIELTD